MARMARIPATEEDTAIPIVAPVLRAGEEEGELDGADLERSLEEFGVEVGVEVGFEVEAGVEEGPALEGVALGGGDGSLKFKRLGLSVPLL